MQFSPFLKLETTRIGHKAQRTLSRMGSHDHPTAISKSCASARLKLTENARGKSIGEDVRLEVAQL
eukprot:6186435-Pleurochrysis_carterae.AAC.1